MPGKRDQNRIMNYNNCDSKFSYYSKNIIDLLQ